MDVKSSFYTIISYNSLTKLISMDNLFKMIILDNQQNDIIEETVAGIASYFENWSKQWRNELSQEVREFGLNNSIYYDTISPLNLEQAKINSENVIHISKSFLLLVWVLCRDIPKLLEVTNADLDNKKLRSQIITNIRLYIKCLNSRIRVTSEGKYRFKTPRFNKLNESVFFDPNDKRTKLLFYNAVCIILSHEVNHHIDADTTTSVESVDDLFERELRADAKANENMINAFGEAILDGDREKASHIYLGSILGMSTLLFVGSSWSSGIYPDTDDRLAKTIKILDDTIVGLLGFETRRLLESSLERDSASKALKTIEDISNNIPEFWRIGVTVLEVWAGVYKINISSNLVLSFTEDGFRKLAGSLKSKQLKQ